MNNNGIVQMGFFEAESAQGGNDEIVISAEWMAIPDSDFKQAATERHRELDQQEAVIDTLKNRIILEKGELYIATKKKLGHGNFLDWLEEIKVSHTTAKDYMQLARDLKQELTNSRRVGYLSFRQWIKIARSPESKQIVAKIESGDIEPTPQAVNTELEDAKKRAEEAEKAKQEKEEQLVARQRELDIFQEHRKFQEERLKTLEESIKSLKEEKEQIAQSKVQTLQEDTPATKARLAELEKKLKEAEAQQRKLEQEKKDKESQLAQKTKRVETLTDEIKKYALIDKQEKHNEQIRTKWRQACDYFHQGINQGSARLVTSIDAQQAFEPDDWARMAEVEATLRQALDSLCRLRESVTSQFVESSMDYVEA